MYMITVFKEGELRPLFISFFYCFVKFEELREICVSIIKLFNSVETINYE